MNYLNIKLLLTLVIFFSNLTFANSELNSNMMKEDGCIRQELVAEIMQDFEFSASSNVDLNKIYSCDTNNITNVVVRGLIFLKYGKFSLSKKSNDELFFNEFKNISPYDFLKKRVKEIVFTNSYDCSSSSVVAFAKTGEELINICYNNFNNQFKNIFTAGSYAGTVLHEARHIDEDDIGHTTCIRGIEKGIAGACDQSRHQKGAYHYQADYRIYIAKYGKNFHPAIKVKSRADSILLITNKFNNLPKIDIARFIILRSALNNSIFTLNEEKKMNNLKLKLDGTLYQRFDGSFNIFNSNLFSNWEPYDKFIEEARGAYAKEFNNSKLQLKFNDVIYPRTIVNSYISAISIDNYLKYTKTDSKGEIENVIPLPQNDFRKFLNPVICNGQHDRLYLLSNNHLVLEGKINEHNEIHFEKIDNCALDFLNLVQLGKSKIGLTTDGRLLEFARDQWKPLVGFESTRFNFLSDAIDLYQFFFDSY